MVEVDGGKATDIVQPYGSAKGTVLADSTLVQIWAARQQVIDGKDPSGPGRPRRNLLPFIERRQAIINELQIKFPSETPTDTDVAEILGWELRRFQRWKSAAIEAGLLLE